MARSPEFLPAVPGAHLDRSYGMGQWAAKSWERSVLASDNGRRQTQRLPRSEPRVGVPATVLAAEPDARATCAAHRWRPRRRRRVCGAGPLTPATCEWPGANRILLSSAHRPRWIGHSHRPRDDLARFHFHIRHNTRTSAKTDGRL